MRTIRALTIAMAIGVALPTIASAQNGRGFRDSWFWGIKGGGFTFADSAQAYKQAPMGGIDWLITRTRGGLYVSGGQAFFKDKTLTLRDANAPVDSGFRVIDLKNMRRLDVALMGFPGEHLRFHPYFGVGISVAEVNDASPRGPYGNDDQLTFANNVVSEQKVAFAPFFITGAQWRTPWFSVFAQGTLNPANKNFLLYNGRPFNYTYEMGLRYNVGTSIDRQ